MNTKQFYYDGIWEKIESHPGYNLGQRELKALIRFLSVASKTLPRPINILHLGVATGREVPSIIRYCAVKKYLLNDICAPVLKNTFSHLKNQYPSLQFYMRYGDIEMPGMIRALRQSLQGPTLIVLVANGVIFSRTIIDKAIQMALRDTDYFLLTLEMPHARMYDSYLVAPVLQLLSQSRIRVTKNNIQYEYDKNNAIMKMTCKGKTLLVSYKPTPEQLRIRMASFGFREIALAQYDTLHMTASLWKKKMKL